MTEKTDNTAHPAPRTHIVSPAGNVDKLKFAVDYGADEVYFGGDEFNLRMKAGNFSFEDIEESLDYCGSHGVNAVFLLNSFLHQGDIETAERFIAEIRRFRFDAIMVSDPGMMLLIREAGIDTDLHLSTQMSTLNHLSLKFWHNAGFSRIVMGRETTLEEIRRIREMTDIEIEVFAHGALCIAYSGRCLLSRYLTGRDANQGDCSHACRWNYSLVEKKRPGNELDIIEYSEGGSRRGGGGTEILSSKDLCLISRVPEYIEAGVNAFKIEGRMKSLYHAANTTRIYRHAVELAGTPGFDKNLPFWLEELDLINHRPYTEDLFNEFDSIGFTDIPYIQKALFLGCRESGDTPLREVEVRIFNPVYRGETIDAIFPIKGEIRDGLFMVEEIRDSSGAAVDMARPGQTCSIRFDREVHERAIFRRRQ